jgi:hypothetical protein
MRDFVDSSDDSLFSLKAACNEEWQWTVSKCVGFKFFGICSGIRGFQPTTDLHGEWVRMRVPVQR